MKIAIAIGLALLLGVGAPNCPAAADAGCVNHGGITGCPGRGKVWIGGGGTQEGSHGGAPVSGGPVTRKWISCGSPAAVRALGDPSIAIGRGTVCGPAAVAACRAEGQAAGVPHAIEILLVREPDGSWAFAGANCAAVGPPRVTAELVRDWIVRLVPGARVGVAPAGSTLVNIETVMWVDASRTRSLPGLRILGQAVSVQLSLDHVSWSFGDGSTATTSGPGVPYSEAKDPCHTAMCADYSGHVYRGTGAVTVSATVAWRATFRVAGGPAVAIPGTVSGPAGRADLTVRQARGVLVPDPRGS